MTDANRPPPREGLAEIPRGRLAKIVAVIHPSRHRGLRHFLAALGDWSPIVLTALVLAVPHVPQTIYPYHKWIGFVYLTIQLAEMSARHSNEYGEWMQDHLLSLVPALVSAIMWAYGAFWAKVPLPLQGWETLNWFLGIAWLDFLAGLFIFYRILEQPYQRDEHERR